MKWYYILAIAILAILGFYIIKAFVYMRLCMRPKKDTLKKILERNAYLGFSLEDFESWRKTPFIIESNEAAIIGYKIFNANKSDVWVVLSHGFRSAMQETIKYAGLYYGYGFNCLVYDQRYFGNSTGKCCTMGYHESGDLKNIINMLTVQEGEDIFILVHGESMGAVSALCALQHTDKIKAVISDCAFADNLSHYKWLMKTRFKLKTSFPLIGFTRILTGLYVKGYDFKKVSPITAVKNTDTPILFIHGTADTVVPRENSVKLFNAAKNPDSAIYLAEGAEHALSIFQNVKQYDLRLREFLNSVFKHYGKDLSIASLQSENTLENFYKYHKEETLPQEEMPQNSVLKDEEYSAR